MKPETFFNRILLPYLRRQLKADPVQCVCRRWPRPLPPEPGTHHPACFVGKGFLLEEE